MDVTNLPIELQYKILSFLPYETLRAMKLTNKEYWEIFRSNTVTHCAWDDSVDWCSKFSDTHILRLTNGGVHILTISDLHHYYQDELGVFYTNTKIKCTNLSFKLKEYGSGYLWIDLDCAQKSVPTLNVTKSSLNVPDETNLFGKFKEIKGEVVGFSMELAEETYCFYDKYRQSIDKAIVCGEYDFGQIVQNSADAIYEWSDRDDDEYDDEDDDEYDYEVDDKYYDYYSNNECYICSYYYYLDDNEQSVHVKKTDRLPICEYITSLENLEFLFYLAVVPDLEKVKLKLTEHLQLNDNIHVNKVFTYDKETNCKIGEIGRVVITKKLQPLMDHCCVSFRQKDNVAIGFGIVPGLSDESESD